MSVDSVELPEGGEEADDVDDDAADQALLLAASHDKDVEVWHLGRVTGAQTYASAAQGAMLVQQCDKPVVDVAFSPDSTAVAVASLDGYVRFFMVCIFVCFFFSLSGLHRLAVRCLARLCRAKLNATSFCRSTRTRRSRNCCTSGCLTPANHCRASSSLTT